MIDGKIVYNSKTINDRTTLPLSESAPFYIAVNSVDGLFDNDIRYESHIRPHQHGERSADSFYTGKQIVLSGTLDALSQEGLWTGRWYLQEMFGDLAMHKLYFYPLFLARQSYRMYLTCRKNQPLNITDQISTFAFRRNWTVGLRADDPTTFRVGTGDTGDGTKYPTFQPTVS